MTRNVECCSPDSTLAEAAQKMWERDCGSLPVCDREERVVGMITDRDICMAAWLQGKPLQELRVEDAMSRDVIACRPDDPMRRAETLMEERQIRRLPVVTAENRLMGIVSLGDMARATEGDGVAEPLRPRELAHTIAAISRPRAATEHSAAS